MQCPQCHKICEPDHRFCSYCGTALPRVSTSTDDIRLTRFTSSIPDPLANKMRAAHIAGERKIVTSLFADVVGSTAIAEKIDAEVWTEIMNHAFERFSQVIYQYEGTIARLMGDAILAFFGAPVAHEDEPVRAVHAALDILDSAGEYAEEVKQRYNIEFAIRVGINSGMVVVGEVGSDLKYEYTAMGDAINLASRLQSTADPNQIVVSRSVYNATKIFFDYKPLKSVKVKGKEGKVERYLPVGLKEVFQELKGLGYSQLVGRDREMEIIQNMVGAVGEPPLHLSYKGGLLEIKGEAGIGKSRLKYELRQLLKDKEILFYQGYCPAYEVPIPYYPFSLILKEVLKLTDGGNEESQKQALADSIKGLGEDLIDTVPYLGAILSLVYEEVAALDDTSRQERIFSAMKRLLERLSHQKPIVLVFEDVQWIDSLSKSLLTYLIEHCQELPILFCCLYRPEFEPSWTRVDRVQISLRAISKEEELRLIESLLGGLSLPQNLVDLILSKSEGNPFYLEEMIRSLMDQGILVKGRRGFELKGEIGQIDIPDTIQGVIMSRLDRLEQRSKETLQYASVIGREFPQRILEEISERGGEVEEHLSLLQRLELIFQKQLMPELEYIFKHFLTQEVAYNSILLKKRRELHLKIAKAIEKVYRERLEEYYELLGYHYERAQSWLKAAEYFGKAGKKAEEIHSGEITKEHREREEVAYGRLIFWLVLVAIGIGVGFSYMAIFIRVHMAIDIRGPFQVYFGALTLNQFEVYERLSHPIFRVLYVPLFLFFGWTLLAFGAFRAFTKVFCPIWFFLTKIDWRHPFRITPLFPTRLIIFFLSSAIVWLPLTLYMSHFLSYLIGIKVVAGTLAFMVSGALFWLAFSREGILRNSAKVQLPPLNQAVWIGLHGAFAGGLIYNIIGGGLLGLISGFATFPAFNFLLFGIISFESIAKFIAGTILIFFWMGLVVGTGLFVSARPDISLKKRLKASSFGWIIGLMGIVIGLMFYYLVMVGKYDYGRDPAQVIGIPKAASSNKTVIRFTREKQPLVIQKPLHVRNLVTVTPFYFGLVKVNSSDGLFIRSYPYTLDANEGSIQKAMDYLQQRNYIETTLYNLYFGYIFQAQRLNWDFDSMMEWLYKHVKSGSPGAPGSMHFFMYEIMKMSAMRSPKQLEFLDDIAKDERFYFPPRLCEQIGTIYLGFPRREDAIYWYKRAGLSEQRLKEIENEPLPFIKGSIEGKILISDKNDKTVSGIKVGLLRSTVDFIPKADNIDRGVKASTETDSEGVFRFEYLIEGEYRLAIMVDEKLIPADANKVKVVNAPGRIVLNAQNPTVDLGEIKIIVAK